MEKYPPISLLDTHKLQFVWRDRIAKKIFLDILGNSQFRRCKFVKKKFQRLMDKYIFEMHLNDEDIYSKFHDYFHNRLPRAHKLLLNLDNHEYRSHNRAQKINTLIRRFLNRKVRSSIVKDEPSQIGDGLANLEEYTKTKHCKTSDSISILDIGCAQGHITVSIGDYLDLSPSQIHGCDVIDLSEDHPNHRKFIYKKINDQSNKRLPYESESSDVILALMSLHHIPQVDDILSEIHRILKKDGIFIIREHDSSSLKFETILDVVHGFYGLVWSNPPEFTKFDEYFRRYFECDELINLIESKNLKCIFNDNRKEPYPMFYRNKVVNPLKHYYAVFRK